MSIEITIQTIHEVVQRILIKEGILAETHKIADYLDQGLIANWSAFQNLRLGIHHSRSAETPHALDAFNAEVAALPSYHAVLEEMGIETPVRLATGPLPLFTGAEQEGSAAAAEMDEEEAADADAEEAANQAAEAAARKAAEEKAAEEQAAADKAAADKAEADAAEAKRLEEQAAADKAAADKAAEEQAAADKAAADKIEADKAAANQANPQFSVTPEGEAPKTDGAA